MSPALTGLAELLHRATGIHLKPSHHTALEAAVARTAPDLVPSAFLELARHPETGAETLARLVDEVTIKETFFLRDAGQLGSIDWRGLHASAIAAGSDVVRVWSAACSTGEEPYSLALLACEAFESSEPPVRIVGTDISRTALDRARLGRYGPRSVRALDEPLRERHLDAREGAFVVRDHLRRLVSFGRHNLVADAAPLIGGGAFDLIVCRNVLIYFNTETVARVVPALEAALAPGGTLMLGAADVLCDTARRLAAAEAPPPARPQPRRTKPARPDGRRHRVGIPKREPAPTAEQRLALALRAADEGRPGEAAGQVSSVLRAEPLNATAHLVLGLLQLASGEAEPALGSLRRALYLDPRSALAAFKLGRAHELLGDGAAAARSYEQALRALEGNRSAPDLVLGDIDLDDVAAACRGRLEVLGR